MELRSVGIIGYGAFGSFMHELLRRYAPQCSVAVHSRSQAEGIDASSLEEVCACNAVVLAVPIHAYEETLTEIAPLLAPQTILVDVATVKGHTVSLIKSIARTQPFIATHPMFGPYSYEKKDCSLEGLRLVIAGHTLPQESYARLKEFLYSIGLVVLEMSPDEHDKMLAETLFLTHYIGRIVSEGNFRRTDIDTVSFGFLMDAVESVQNDTELFKDVYRYNPYCRKVVEQFEAAEATVGRLLGNG